MSKTTLIVIVVVLTLLSGGLFFARTDSEDSTPQVSDEFVQITDEVEPSATDVSKEIAELSTFSSFLDITTYETFLDDDGLQFTIFVPSDEAFAALGEETLNRLRTPEGRNELSRIISNHISYEFIRSADFTDGQVVPTLGIAQHPVSTQGEDISVGGATIIRSDIETSNSVLHIVDKVIVQ